MLTSSSNSPSNHDPAQQAQDLHEATRLLAASLARPADAVGPTPRDVALGLFRRHLARIQQTVRDAFEQHELSGTEAAYRLALLTDGLILTLHDYTLDDVLADSVGGQTLTGAATGGYGRGLLAPFSDI